MQCQIMNETVKMCNIYERKVKVMLISMYKIVEIACKWHWLFRFIFVVNVY